VARIRIALALAVAAAFVPAGQAAAAPGDAKPAPAAAAGASAPAALTTEKRRRRPGCGRFCRQAGGFGAPPDPPPPPVKIASQTIRVAGDGLIGIRAKCRRKRTCVGAILVSSDVEYGRANLRIPAGKTRTVLVAVTAKARRHLESQGRDRQVYATVPLTADDAPVSISGRLTLLPPR
jgi:hypothetical protein